MVWGGPALSPSGEGVNLSPLGGRMDKPRPKPGSRSPPSRGDKNWLVKNKETNKTNKNKPKSSNEISKKVKGKEIINQKQVQSSSPVRNSKRSTCKEPVEAFKVWQLRNGRKEWASAYWMQSLQNFTHIPHCTRQKWQVQVMWMKLTKPISWYNQDLREWKSPRLQSDESNAVRDAAHWTSGHWTGQAVPSIPGAHLRHPLRRSNLIFGPGWS